MIWFRRDLRLHDNAALSHALHAARRLHAVFVFDDEILDALPERADRRVEFIWHSVAALRMAIAARGGAIAARGGELCVLRGAARTLIPRFAARVGAGAVFAARDYEPAAVARDTAIAAALRADGRELRLVKDQVIFDTDQLLTAAGRPYHVFTPYRRAWLAKLDEQALAPYPVEARLDRLAPADEADERGPPDLQALGFQAGTLAGLDIAPGEAGARALLDAFRQRIDHYREARDFPARQGPSRLSVHLRFGTVSIRELARFAWRHGGEGADTWLSELIWREFYQMLLWHYPETVDHCFQRKFEAIVWPNPAGHFDAWREARTGYPIIDAAMRQLERTGYMHNRLRMLAASFLVKDLHVDWRLGERHFAAKLLDYEQASNVGGWQWSAGVGTDAQPWFRVFNPVTQSEKFDPAGEFIRAWLPELAAVPDKYLHAPWKLPAAEQARHGFVPGRDYPPPIVEHAEARATTLALFKAASGG